MGKSGFAYAIAFSLLIPQTSLLAGVPDNPTQISEPGWGKWQPLSAASTASQRLGVIVNSSTVNPGDFPALIVRHQQRDWLRIEQPITGWVSIATVPEGFLNLKLCQ